MPMFSVNKVLNIIKTDIDANFTPGYTFRVRNLFGIPVDEWEKELKEANSIFLVWERRENERESNMSMEGIFRLTFIIVEQTIARAAAKEDYLIDKLMAFLTEDGFGKEFTGLVSEYSTFQFEPFYPESDYPESVDDAGNTIFFIEGYMNYHLS